MKTKLTITVFFIFHLFCYSAHAQTYRIVVVPEGTKKCGYIDLTGKMIVEAQYNHCFKYTDDGTALISKGYNKWDLIDKMGNEIIPDFKLEVQIGLGTSIFLGGMLRMEQEYKFGGINTNGKYSVPFIYDKLTDFNGGYALGERDKVYYVVDKNGKESLIENNKDITYIKHFTEGLAPIETNGKRFGFVDTLGKIVIAPQFETVGYFSAGIAWVRIMNGTIGFINKNGEWVIEPHLASARNFDEESGLAMVKTKTDNSHWLYIDTTGKLQYFKLTEKQYGFSNGLAKGKLNKKFGYLNNKGEWAIIPVFDDAHDFKNGHAAVKIGKRWGLINKKGDWVLQPEYKDIGEVVVIQ